MKNQKRPDKLPKTALVPFLWLLLITPKISEFLHSYFRFRFLYGPITLIAVYILIRRWDRFKLLLGHNKLILVFLGYMGLSVLWSEHLATEQFHVYITSVLAFFIVCLILTEKNPRKTACIITKKYLVILLLFSILLYLFYIRDITTLGANLAIHKNIFGQIMAFSVIFFLWSLMDKGKNKNWLYDGSFLMFSLFFLITNKSVNAYGVVAVAFVMFAFLIFTKPFKKHIIAIIFLCVILSASLISLYLVYNPNPLLETAVESTGRDMTFTGRTNIWSFAISKANQPVFGYGFLGFWNEKRRLEAYNSFGYSPPHGHNGFLDTYLNLGLVGLSLIAIMIFFAYKRIFGLIKIDHYYGSLWLVLLTGVLFADLFESFLFGNSLTNFSWFIFLLAAADVPNRLLPKPLKDIKNPISQKGQNHKNER